MRGRPKKPRGNTRPERDPPRDLSQPIEALRWTVPDDEHKARLEDEGLLQRPEKGPGRAGHRHALPSDTLEKLHRVNQAEYDITLKDAHFSASAEPIADTS